MSHRSRRLSSIDLKIVVLGSASVGKTCLIHRFCNGSFLTSTLPTIGAGFFPHTMQIGETEISMMLWDTAGEERFKSVAPSLLRGSNGLVLVYDVTSIQTFPEIDDYLNLFLDTAEYDPSMTLPVMLLGNKCDCEDRSVPRETVDSWLDKHKVKHFAEVSAKTGDGIEEAFREFLSDFLNAQTKEEIPSIPINQPAPVEKKKCDC
ncbi:small GTP-binding protein [Tritrichomonas foetus]|uniref:Small GTP-binding protein n=1 Tax=Tritrichomonas foetus TaxID=1144522 RepID=A0A1J4KBH6_9EUKA|nr:small GTP-binding protein [Tritrichomonas foetus]|eukprot:OHT06829.1 small GTP-binding protein [Tritrichomonas foetus]